jgi:dihydroceramidase
MCVYCRFELWNIDADNCITADPWQLVDELSMIYTTCLMFYATFSYGRSALYSVGLAVFLTSLSLFITLYYHYLQDPVFHQVAYAILTAIVFFRSIYIMEVRIRPSRRAKHTENDENGSAKSNATSNGLLKMDKDARKEQQRKDARDTQILKTMWTMIAIGLGIFLGGFGFWNLDNIYCGRLRSWRHQIGLPWGIVLEGHGWW